MPLPSAIADAQKLTQIGERPYLYRFSSQTNDGNKEESALFITSIRECGFDRNSPSLIATTRRLLVGLNSIRLRDQKEIILAGQNVTTSQISGRFNENPVELATFSINHGQCVTDLVGWFFPKDTDSTMSANLAELVEPIAIMVAKEIDASSGN